MRGHSWLLWITIGALLVAAALGIASILSLSIGPGRQRVIATALLIGGFSLVALLCAIVLDRRCLPGLMRIGIGAALAAGLLWLSVVWIGPATLQAMPVVETRLYTFGFTLTIGAIWSAHTGFMMLPRIDSEYARIFRLGTLAVAGGLALLILGVVWFPGLAEDMLQLLAVAVILTAAGTVITPTLALVDALRRRGEPEDIDARIRISLSCPRCGAPQHLLNGARRCDACGLRITVLVEEPRCDCGYLLYHLQGDRCPECGEAVPERDRWVAARDAHGDG